MKKDIFIKIFDQEILIGDIDILEDTTDIETVKALTYNLLSDVDAIKTFFVSIFIRFSELDRLGEIIQKEQNSDVIEYKITLSERIKNLDIFALEATEENIDAPTEVILTSLFRDTNDNELLTLCFGILTGLSFSEIGDKKADELSGLMSENLSYIIYTK